MAELTSTPPRAITHPETPAKPVDAIINGTRLEFSVDGEEGKKRVIVRLSATSWIEMTPSAALGIAGMIVRQALKAAPGTSDERVILARMLAEMRRLEAPTAAVPGVE